MKRELTTTAAIQEALDAGLEVWCDRTRGKEHAHKRRVYSVKNMGARDDPLTDDPWVTIHPPATPTLHAQSWGRAKCVWIEDDQG